MTYWFEALSVMLIYCTHDSFLTFYLSHIYFTHFFHFRSIAPIYQFPMYHSQEPYNRLDLSVYHNRRLLEQQLTPYLATLLPSVPP